MCASTGLTPALISVVPLTGFVFTSYGVFSFLWDKAALGKVGQAFRQFSYCTVYGGVH